MCTVHWRGWSRATVCSVKSSPAAWHVCPFLKKHFKSFEVPWWERTGLPAWELSCLDPYLNVLSDSCSLFSQDTAGGIDTFERWCDKNTNKINQPNNTVLSWKQLAIVAASSFAFLSCVKNTCGTQSMIQIWRKEWGQVYRANFSWQGYICQGCEEQCSLTDISTLAKSSYVGLVVQPKLHFLPLTLISELLPKVNVC